MCVCVYVCADRRCFHMRNRVSPGLRSSREETGGCVCVARPKKRNWVACDRFRESTIASLLSDDLPFLVWARSWLHDTLKRKLVDFAWIRRFFYLPSACSLFSGKPG